MASTIAINANEAVRDLRVEIDIVVTGIWLLKLRLWLAALLIKMAGLVSGMTVDLARPLGEMATALGMERGSVPADFPLACSVSSPDFHLYDFSKVDILLNGAPVDQAIAYDVIGCWVEAHALDDDGMVRLNEERDHLITQRRYGRVDLRLKPVEPAN